MVLLTFYAFYFHFFFKPTWLSYVPTNIYKQKINVIPNLKLNVSLSLERTDMVSLFILYMTGLWISNFQFRAIWRYKICTKCVLCADMSAILFIYKEPKVFSYSTEYCLKQTVAYDYWCLYNSKYLEEKYVVLSLCIR